MSATLGDAVMSNIRGMQDAQHLLDVVRQGCAPADALLQAMEKVRGTGDPARLRGFMRECQKALERVCG